MRFRLAFILALVVAVTLPLAAYQPSSTSPYTFTGTAFCSSCETFSHEKVGDGFHHDSGCNQSGSPLYFCSCSIGYNSGLMLQQPILRVIDDHTVELEYFARNAYCNPPADFGNINEPNAIPYQINVIEIDPITLATNPTPKHVVPPYWEHGKVQMTDMNPGCKMYRAIYVVTDTFFNTWAVSSDIVGGTGTSTCPMIPDMGSCPIGNGPGGGISPSVGKPINVGSGNMLYQEPLFRVTEPGAASLDFTISYNSAETNVGPLGPGFTNPFAQSMKSTTGTSNVRVWRRPDGTRVLFARENHPPIGEYWRPIYPGDATGSVAHNTSTGRYLWTDLKGNVTEVDNSAGLWRKTTDRWGNTITGSYTGSNLTSITDTLGRVWTLGYSGSLLTSITDGDSNQWRFEYDGSNRLEKIFDPLHTSTTPWRQFAWTTYATGKSAVALVTDESGAVLEGHEYDSSGRATSSWSGATISGSAPSPGTNARDLVTLSYDSPTQTTVTTKIDTSINENTVYALLVGHGRVLATSIVGTCASCGSTEEAQAFTFDDENHILQKTVGLDKTSTGGSDERVTSTYTYNANGMVLTATAADGTADEHTTTFAYGHATWPEFVTSVTEDSVAKSGQSRTTTYAWNTGETELTTTTSGYQLSTDSSATTYTTTTHFDSRHRVTQTDGPRTNQKTTRTYYSDSDATLNRRGRLQETNAYVTTTANLSSALDDCDIYGAARTRTDPNGVATTVTLDARGRVLTETSVKPTSDSNEPANYVATYVYDGRDRLTSSTSPRGTIARRVYEDGTNRLLQTIRADSSGNEHERMLLSLNTIGRVTSEAAQDCDTPANPCSSWTTRRSETFEWDATGRLVTVTHPDSTFTENTYDSRGNVVGVQDERHSAANTIYAYDARNRLTTVTQKRTIVSGSDVVTEYTYDDQSNLDTVTDPNGNVTTYDYDDFGRVQSQASPVTGTTTYSYDAANNLTSTSDANSATTSRTYDLLHRLLTATSTRTSLPTETVTWTWDDATAGNYGLGRIATMEDPAGITGYAYERRGLIRYEERFQDPNYYITTYQYDSSGNRSSITYPSTLVAAYTFDFADRPASVSWNSSSLVSSVAYAPYGSVKSIAFANGTTQTMTYDARYRIQTNVLASSGTLASYSYGYDATSNITTLSDVVSSAYNRTFGYDDLNRVVTANGGASLWGSGSYTYDAMGSMLTSTLGSQSTSFSYSGTTPKLTSVTEGLTTTSVSYDSAGNETSTAISSRNHLAGFGGPRTFITYGYDGRGVRMVAVDDDVFLDQHRVHDHLYSPDLRPLALYDYIYELFSTIISLDPQPPFSITEYIWLGDRPIAQFNTASDTSTTLRYTFADHLATPILQTNPSAAVIWRPEYKPYGSLYNMRAGLGYEQRLRFPGQEFENFGDRTYNMFRWYRGAWARYTQADPIGLNGGANLYAYVGGQPTGQSDPYGLFTIPLDRYYNKCRTLRKGYAQRELDRVRQEPSCRGFFRNTCNSDLERLFNDPLPRIQLVPESRRSSGGAFDTNTPDVIYISMRECKAMEDFAHTVIHELGHYGDYHNNNDAISDANHSDGCRAEIECFGFTRSMNCRDRGFQPYKPPKRF
jgi:RHS repeat-associated protein